MRAGANQAERDRKEVQAEEEQVKVVEEEGERETEEKFEEFGGEETSSAK